jgi:hypothetical protein
MADTWLLEGEWLKNCNCDPGCPCDFNQHPTNANCEGAVAMRIEKGHVNDLDVSGLHWAAVVWWPGRMDEGNGTVQFLIDERATAEQREALDRVFHGGGDTLFEIVAAVCPDRRETLFVPFEWEFDLGSRTSRVKAGDVFETEVDTLRGFGEPPPPYRIVVTIPGGFEYTGEGESAETAVATKLRASSEVRFEHENTHSSITRVLRGSGIGSGAEPVVSAA